MSSIRSMPLLSDINPSEDRSASRLSIQKAMAFESRITEKRRSRMGCNWRDKINPEVLEKYDEIMSQGWSGGGHSHHKQKSVLNVHESPIKSFELTPSKPIKQV